MKRINKKGFTLVELISVIAILGLLLIIGASGVSMIQRNTRNNLYCTKVASFESAAIMWGNNNRDVLPQFTGDLNTVHGRNAFPQNHRGANNIYTRRGRINLQLLLDEGQLQPDRVVDNRREIVDPRDGSAMNLNNNMLFVYIRNNRVQAHFEPANANDRPC